jgi:hypothetical protein
MPQYWLDQMDPASDMACAGPAARPDHRAYPTARKVEFQSATSRRALIYVRHAIVAASCAGIAAVLIIVATGNSGFIHTV